VRERDIERERERQRERERDRERERGNESAYKNKASGNFSKKSCSTF
jgi:hypothetical protein